MLQWCALKIEEGAIRQGIESLQPKKCKEKDLPRSHQKEHSPVNTINPIRRVSDSDPPEL